MKNIFAILAIATVGTITACSDSADTTAPSTSEASATDSTLRGSTDDWTIPAECLESDEAFERCWDDELIPDECFDEEGYLLDVCLDDDDSEGGGETVEPPSDDAVTSGFDPSVDAFSFANYGALPEVVNLTPAELQRMFGSQVCANETSGCTLTPPARQWMEQMNKAMEGGHCEGMAVLASLFFSGEQSPSDYGASTTNGLSLDGNELLQREIAYWFVTQLTYPGSSVSVDATPSVVLDTLIQSLSEGQNASESWAIGIFKRDFTGGHAVTPYAVEDQGDGTYHVYVYDNNYPSIGRILTIDRNAETWQYEASTNPSVQADLYEGDAGSRTLQIVAISPRLQPQEIWSDGGDVSGVLGAFQAEADAIEVWLDGDANLLITADDGRRIGWLPDGTFVDEIEGASSTGLKFLVDVWDIDQEPVYTLPRDLTEFTITVDASQVDEQTLSEVTLIGPDFNMVVEDIILDPGEADTITVGVDSGDLFVLEYQSDYSDSPDIWLGLVTDEADHEFIVRGTDIEPGGAFKVALDFVNGDFILNTFDQREYGLYDLRVARYDDEGEYFFSYDDIELLPDDTMYVNFLEWEGDGSPMYLDFDFETDGIFDEVLVLDDQAGTAADFEE